MSNQTELCSVCRIWHDPGPCPGKPHKFELGSDRADNDAAAVAVLIPKE
jgi:hypothetical protein